MNLVTGATGHIGNVLTRKILEKGGKVRALVLPGEDHTPLENLDVEVVEGNILDPESLQAAFANVENVYHLAGLVSILPGRDRTVERVNVEGTRNIVQAALQNKVRRLIYTSSIHAIQRAPHGTTIDEQIPFDSMSAAGAYDYSKAIASLTVLASICQGLDAVIVCPTGVLGPYDFRLSEMGNLIKGCIDRKPQLFVDGAYDFVDVRDVADGLIMAADKGKTGHTYILSGERITVPGLLEAVWEITGDRFHRIRIPFSFARFLARFMPIYYRLAHVRPRFTTYSLDTLASNSFISNAKARAELGYQPRSLRESLTDTIAWIKQNQAILTHTAQNNR